MWKLYVFTSDCTYFLSIHFQEGKKMIPWQLNHHSKYWEKRNLTTGKRTEERRRGTAVTPLTGVNQTQGDHIPIYLHAQFSCYCCVFFNENKLYLVTVVDFYICCFLSAVKHARPKDKEKEKERENERRKRQREEQDKARREWERQKRREQARMNSRRERWDSVTSF